MPRTLPLAALLLLLTPWGQAQEVKPEAEVPTTETRAQTRPRARLGVRLERFLRQRTRALRRFDRDHDGRLSDLERGALLERRRAKREELKQRGRERRLDSQGHEERGDRIRRRARLLRRLESLRRRRAQELNAKSERPQAQGDRGCCTTL